MSFENGATGTWDYTTPGRGSNTNALDFSDYTYGHAIDGNQTLFSTRGGRTWDVLGIKNVDYNFYGIDSDRLDDVGISGGGSVYDWNGSEWRRADTGDAGLYDLEITGDDGLAVGGGGAVFRLWEDWIRETAPVGDNPKAVARGPFDIAVGAGGTVIER